jgi:hypothetical protein
MTDLEGVDQSTHTHTHTKKTRLPIMMDLVYIALML